jgi:hypothetical protein
MTMFGRLGMPSLGGAIEWLNPEPLGPAELRGHVVLVDFWTRTCINWLRMAPGGERPGGNAVPSGGAPVEEPLAGWRLAALADRSKRPKSSPWQVPAEMELRALSCDHGTGHDSRAL